MKNAVGGGVEPPQIIRINANGPQEIKEEETFDDCIERNDKPGVLKLEESEALKSKLRENSGNKPIFRASHGGMNNRNKTRNNKTKQ